MPPFGPVAAKSEVGQLFDGKQYDLVKMTPPEIGYQLFLLERAIDKCVWELGQAKGYVKHLAKHMRFTLFALVVRALQAAGASFGDEEFTESLQNELDAPATAWLRFVDDAVRQIRAAYKIESVRFKKTKGETLPLGNFFKNKTYIAKIFDKPLPLKLRQKAKKTL